MKIEKNQCTGCSACVNMCPKGCISMKMDEEGFLYPYIEMSECIHCGLCDKVCPAKEIIQSESATKVYAVINRDEQIRLESSSGGVFTLLADYILEKKGIVYGAVYADDFSVEHIGIESKEQLYKLRSAKYTQSELGRCFKGILEKLKKGQYVLFSGTPCQVAGLKSFLGKEYINLITVDLVCHGVPSAKIWKAYIKNRANRREIRKINMRCKASGWSNYGYSTVFEYKDGYKEQKRQSQDMFMQAFTNDLCLRPSCHECKFKGVQRISDFTLGDYWGVWVQHPELDDDKGTSLLMVHTESGKKILSYLQEKVCMKEETTLNFTAFNRSIVESSPVHSKRNEYLNEIDEINFEEKTREYLYGDIELKQEKIISRIKFKIKRLLNS